MTMTAFRLALGASLLVLTAGVAWSDGAPADTTRLAAIASTCAAPPAQPANKSPVAASTTVRHTNVVRVRYTAAHAMPAKRPVATLAEASCTPKGDSTALD